MLRRISFHRRTISAFTTLVIGLIIGLPFQTADAANCDGLPVMGGVIPAGIYTMTDNCATTSTLTIASGTEVTINGGGFTLDGGNTHGVLAVDADAALSLDNVTVANGLSNFGGGIVNGGTLLVSNSFLSNNSANASGGGVINISTGMLTIQNSTLSGNSASFGGGIRNLGPGVVNITDTMLSNNVATDGGGISNVNGTITLNNSMLSDNSASSGGAIHNAGGGVTIANSTLSGNSTSPGGGGGIFNSATGLVTINNSTLSGNSAEGNGGGIYSNGTITVTNSTLSGNSTALNGGGILNSGGTVSITNSTFSGNISSLLGSGVYNGPGTTAITSSTLVGSSNSGIIHNPAGMVSIINSVVANSAGQDCTGDASYNATNNRATELCGTQAITGLDLSLANNGGPTMTHALLPGSNAINAAIDCPPPTIDQRGVVRPQGMACDIGAYESSLTEPPGPPDGVPPGPPDDVPPVNPPGKGGNG